MKSVVDWSEHEVNRETLYEMECLIPMTLRERKALHTWVNKGHDPESNPWGYFDADGEQLNYLQAFRLEFGYLEGPWDYWKGSHNSDLNLYRRIGPDLIPIEEL